MRKVVLLSAGLLVVCLATSAFAVDPIDDDKSFGGDGLYSITGTPPDYTLTGTNAVGSGGVGAIAAYGDTPSFTGMLRATADISRNTNYSDCGLVFQLDDTTFTGYALTIDFSTGALDIMDLTGGGESTSRDHDTISSWDADATYSAVFTYNGGAMTGSLYNASEQLVGSVAWTATTPYTGAYCGVLVSYNDMGITTGSFEDYNVTPEPCTLLLLGTGLAALKLRRRK